jgi:Outer membrane protein
LFREPNANMKTTPRLSPFFLSVILCVWVAVVRAQEPQPPKLKLGDAVELALKNYPAIRAAKAQAQSAEAGIESAKTVLLPRADLLWQQNRATRNNLFGLLLPQATLPSISGPQLDTTSLETAWGSAAGLLVSWEPFDFGLRKSQIELAKAQHKQAAAAEALTQLDVSAAAADAFLTLLAAEQTVRAAQANVERTETLAKSVAVLVTNQLRPGVDSSRAEAELAAARNQLIQAEQTAELARANLAEAIGQPGANLSIESGKLLEVPPALSSPSLNFLCILGRWRKPLQLTSPKRAKKCWSIRGFRASIGNRLFTGEAAARCWMVRSTTVAGCIPTRSIGLRESH